MASRIISIGSALAGNDLPPKGFKDKNQAQGTKCLFDFTNPLCNPSVATTLPTSATFNDLAGGAGATILAGTNYRIKQTADRKGLVYDRIGSNVTFDNVDLGTSQRFDRTKAALFMLWFKQDADGSVTSYIPWFRRQLGVTSSNVATCQFSFDYGSDGTRAEGQATGDTDGDGDVEAFAAVSPPPVLARGAAHLVAFSFIPGVEARLFHDGVQVGASSSAIPLALAEVPTGHIWLSLTTKGTIYRAAIEEIAAEASSTHRTASQAVAAEWAAFNGTFV